MTRTIGVTLRRRRYAWAAALVTVIAALGCGLEEVEIPDLSGPSTTGLGIKLTASPDIIVADGFSSSLVTVQVSDQNGRALSGREIFFTVADLAGNFADVGTLRSTGPDRGVGTGLAVVTDGGGAARVAYVSPPRTDFTGNAGVLISARPVGTDAQGQFYRTVTVELRTAEPRLFPENPGNKVPSCGFTVEPSVGPFRVNQVILFQTTSFDPDGFLVRYEWFFGDGTKEDHPDTNHVWRAAGTYQVVHIVTDNNGARSPACTATVVVIP